MVTVRIIHTEGAAALVEWSAAGQPRRSILPAALVTAKMGEEELEGGIPYGDALEEIIPAPGAIAPEALALELRRRGIWNAEDILTAAGQAAAYGALQYLYQVELAALVKAAAGFVSKKGKGNNE